jgi:hypothetical protein
LCRLKCIEWVHHWGLSGGKRIGEGGGESVGLGGREGVGLGGGEGVGLGGGEGVIGILIVVNNHSVKIIITKYNNVNQTNMLNKNYIFNNFLYCSQIMRSWFAGGFLLR